MKLIGAVIDGPAALLALIYDIGYGSKEAVLDEEVLKAVVVTLEVSNDVSKDAPNDVSEVSRVTFETSLLLLLLPLDVVVAVPNPNVNVVGLATVVIDPNPP